MIMFTHAATEADMEQILALQRKNLTSVLDEKEIAAEGFVTVAHNFELLKAMNQPFPHAIARSDGRVVGYALVMMPSLRNRIPVLIPMFEQIDLLSYQGRLLKQVSYFVMGQVCIDKGFRGQGLFPGLYQQLRKQMQDQFELVITEIATRNVRSLRAHEKVGFQRIHRFTDATDEWELVAWNWT